MAGDRGTPRSRPGPTPPKRSPSQLEERQWVHGRLPGSKYVRIIRPFAGQFQQQARGHLVATEKVLAPRGPLGRMMEGVRRAAVGQRIESKHEIHERVGILKGLAIFASDNISSSAYATEEIMRVLILAGAGLLTLTMPITIVIVVVLAIVVSSYRQIIRAYPGGGASYVVASENLGQFYGLTAAAAVMTDYVLTVAVSIAAGVAALTSIFPGLFEQRVLLGVLFVAGLWLGNLRGIREIGGVFAVPTYVYLLAIYGLLGLGLWHVVGGSLPAYSPPPGWAEAHGAEAVGLLLILRAFASGSVALTGTESVSNGVPAFRPPAARNAAIVLVLMGTAFGSIFLGMSLLAGRIGIVPDPSEQTTVISQIAATLTGEGSPYHVLIQLSTALLLVLAANTAFNGFPRLASILGSDRFLPRQFQFRGDRLAFSFGIAVLAVLAALLIVVFEGSVTNLIPLYTVGVFLAFTLSQVGMVRRWWRLRDEEPGWRRRAVLNGIGAAATGTVLVVVGVAKFALGAWIMMMLIPALIALMWSIKRHYDAVESELAVDWSTTALPKIAAPIVLVPVARLDKASLLALSYARSISDQVIAFHVTDDRDDIEEFRRVWDVWGEDVQLVVVESPFRALLGPLLAYIDAVDKLDPKQPITVVLGEYVPRHFWEYPLHNQTALRIKLRLFFRPRTVVIDVPYHHVDKRGRPA